MKAEQLLEQHKAAIHALCDQYRVTRLRLFGSALSNTWNSETSDFDFLAEFDPPQEMNAFEQYMGFILDMKALLGREVDVVDWNAAKNPFFRRNAETQAREIYAA